MSIEFTSLSQVLKMMGTLDDSPGDDTPRERFRRYFLQENVREIGQVRDYIEECLREKGSQYDRALQDLVNHIGHFLGFEVTFGRYQGVKGQIGYDGHWESPKDFHIVVEVKTAETFAISTKILVGYVDELISGKQISNWENALGLYVVGRPDPKLRQLENNILGERRTDQLRIISVESLLSLAELINEFDIDHEDILTLLRPSSPMIDSVVDLMTRLVAEPKDEETPRAEKPQELPELDSGATYWMTPVKSDKEATSEEVIQTLVNKEGIYAFGERTPGRKNLKPGDWMCFYASGKGVVAHAQVESSPEKKPHPKVRHSDKYPWVFRVERAKLYFDEPTVIDALLRSHLDAFREKDPSKAWAWFVQATRSITAHDFGILTRQEGAES